MLNIDKLYSEGYDSFLLDDIYIKRLEKLIMNETWVELDISESNTIKSAPKWILDSTIVDKSKNGLTSFKEGNPSMAQEFKTYKRLFELMLSENKYNGHLNTYYDMRVNTIQLWDGVEEHPDFHWDGKVNGDMFWLIYLSDRENWDQELGGGFMCGTRTLSDKASWEGDNMNVDNVNDIETFWPDNGRIVFCNNLNPKQIHRPIALSQKAKELNEKRITFLVSIKLNPKSNEY